MHHQKQKRMHLIKQLAEMEKNTNDQEKLIAMNQNLDRVKKMMNIDRRNLLTTAQNYLAHPQVEDL